jgi:hypothetical protein
MPKIKNDPNRYIRRSTLAGRRNVTSDEKSDQAERKRDRDFLNAPIDHSLYVDFRTKS